MKFNAKTAVFLIVVAATFPAWAKPARLSDHELIADAVSRAWNSAPESEIGNRMAIEQRNTRVLTGSNRIRSVCGEIRSHGEGRWRRFHFSEISNRVEVEPHPEINADAKIWFSSRCREAVGKLSPGGSGSQQDSYQCEAASLFASAAYENAKFDFGYALECQP